MRLKAAIACVYTTHVATMGSAHEQCAGVRDTDTNVDTYIETDTNLDTNGCQILSLLLRQSSVHKICKDARGVS